MSLDLLQPPPLPPWEGMHPLVVHFPIALLMVAPLLMLLGLVFPARSFGLAALVVMVLGVAAAWVSTATGEAAYGAMEVADEFAEPADELADKHSELTHLARNIFTVLTALYVVVLIVSSRTENKQLRLAAPLLVLALWAPALGILANAAHSGGELVHRYGAKAPLAELPELDAAPVE